ncbi:hypothetical protein LEMLEM_LOCUS25794, partial [Lemmus lemmus]
VYRVNSRTGSKATEKPCLEKQRFTEEKDKSAVAKVKILGHNRKGSSEALAGSCPSSPP